MLEYKKASELRIGDIIVTMSSKPVKITKISKGFYQDTLILDWGIGCDWACVDKELWIMTKHDEGHHDQANN